MTSWSLCTYSCLLTYLGTYLFTYLLTYLLYKYRLANKHYITSRLYSFANCKCYNYIKLSQLILQLSKNIIYQTYHQQV
ncbi:Orf132 [Heliothis zea nudivirus]|uniref:Orf132 n=1 Tax=Heliothis zea nudivirus 1 TaxID=3116536 RepID=Q8JKI1_9VIRU|nr:Orf132 [Heliothis zea nudivirus]AAN04424.1 Orf132 [Heliothis zea nudivirus]